MSLPRELRDKVYEGLLCSHIYETRDRWSKKAWRRGLEPGILRTCKRVCEEASKVLYSKNATIMIRIDAEAYELFRKTTTSKGHPTFTEVFPIAKVECGKVGGVPILGMEISVLPQYGAKDKAVPEGHIVFIGFFPVLPRICKFITCRAFAAKLQLVVHMESPIERPPEIR